MQARRAETTTIYSLQGHGTKSEAHVVQGNIKFCVVVGGLMRFPWFTGVELSKCKSSSQLASESLERIEVVSIILTPNLSSRARPTDLQGCEDSRGILSFDAHASLILPWVLYPGFPVHAAQSPLNEGCLTESSKQGLSAHHSAFEHDLERETRTGSRSCGSKA